MEDGERRADDGPRARRHREEARGSPREHRGSNGEPLGHCRGTAGSSSGRFTDEAGAGNARDLRHWGPLPGEHQG